MSGNLLKDVKARIDQEDIVELDLSQIKIGKITGDLKARLDKLKNVEVLILSSCELQSLEGLPNWNLTILDISGNKYILLIQPYGHCFAKAYNISRALTTVMRQ